MNPMLLSILADVGPAPTAAKVADQAAQVANQAAQEAPSYAVASPTVGWVYFGFCAALALLGAIATVASPNPIRGAMGLLMMIISMAGLFLSLHAQFLAAVQVIVYAGAVVVLFLFVIMLLGSDAQTPPDERGRFARYGAAALFSGLGLAALTLLWRTMALPKPPARAPESLGTIEAVGKAIFTETLVPFELSSALLIVAVVGAIAVARGRHGDLVATKGVKGAAAIEKAAAAAKVGAVEISAAEKGAHA